MPDPMAVALMKVVDREKAVIRDFRVADQLKLIETQLRVADGYAKDHIGGDDRLNIWMIQNSHLRSQVEALREILGALK